MGNGRIRLRGDTAANWTSADPTLALREMAIETDTRKVKIGDGSTAWTSLGYMVSDVVVTANNGITSNSSGVFAKAANGISVTSAGINVSANNGITANTSGTFAAGANGISVTGDGINVLASTGLVSNSTGVHVLANNGIVANTTGVFVAGAVSGVTTLAAGNTTITGFVNATSTIQGGAGLTIAGALSGVTTAAMGNTTITGFANVTSTIQGGAGLTIAGAASGITTLACGNTTITGFANVSSTLQVGGIATFSANVSTTGRILSTRVDPRFANNGATTSGTITPTSDAADQYDLIDLTGTITVAIPSGTPVHGQKLTLRFKDNGSTRTINWTTSAGGYRIVGTTLPTATTANKNIYVGCIYNSVDSFWDVVAVASEA